MWKNYFLLGMYRCSCGTVLTMEMLARGISSSELVLDRLHRWKQYHNKCKNQFPFTY